MSRRRRCNIAYAYDQIDDLLNQKQNIFGAQEGTPQNGQQNQEAQTGVKTNTEGDLGQGGGGSGNAQPSGQKAAVQDEQSQNTEAGRAAVKANAGKTAQPKVFNDIQSQIDSNSQKLQDEANSYVTNQKANQNYAVDNSNVEKAISGDTNENTNVRSLLNRQTINNVDAFKPSDVNVRDASLVNNDSGLRQLVSRGQGPQYTQGMGAFDLQSLRRTPEFNNLINMIRGNSANLNKSAQDLTTSKTKEVNDFGTENLANSKKAVNDYLDQQRGALDANDLAEMQAENAKLAGYRQNGVGDAEAQAKKAARDAVMGNLSSLNPRATQFLDQVNMDPRQYLNVHDDYKQSDFTNQDEANRFNSIMGLLGKGDIRSGAQALAPEFNFNQDAMQQALQSGALGLRGAKDQENQAQIDAIMRDAQARADADDQRRSKLDLGQLSSKAAIDARSGMDPQLLAYLNHNNELDASKYASLDSRDLNAQDVLGQDEAEKLNALYKDLGSQTVAQAGSGINADGYNFDKSSYLTALQAMLSGAKGTSEQKAQAAAEAKAQAARDAADAERQRALGRTATALGQPTGITVGDAQKIGNLNGVMNNYVNDRLGQIGMTNVSGTLPAVILPKKLVDATKGQANKAADFVKDNNPFKRW